MEDPRLDDLWQINLPKALTTKSAEELISLNEQTELDQAPAPIVDFVLTEVELRKRTLSDEPSWGWMSMPFLPAMEFYDGEAQTRINRGDIPGSVVSYLAYKQNALAFSGFIGRMQNNVLLNSREVKAVRSVVETELSPLEIAIVSKLGSSYANPDESRVRKELANLRRIRGIQNTMHLGVFLDKTPPNKLAACRDFARKKGWYNRAGIISYHLKDFHGAVDDALARIDSYSGLTNETVRESLKMQIGQAIKIKDWQLFTKVIESYAKRQADLERGEYIINYFGVSSPGWYVAQPKWDMDERRMYEGQEKVTPLIIESIMSGSNPGNNMDISGRVKAAQIYIAKMPDVVPKLQQFWRDLPQKRGREYYPYFPRICSRLGISLK